jgi:23S rRNA (uracil1939-C5)-methyltransferase
VEDLLGRLRHPELVIANPPRSGMAQAVTAKLRQLKPKRMVYISCDPATLARDLQRLETMRLVDARAFDLFPQTTHVETVAVLEPQ